MYLTTLVLTGPHGPRSAAARVLAALPVAHVLAMPDAIAACLTLIQDPTVPAGLRETLWQGLAQVPADAQGARAWALALPALRCLAPSALWVGALRGISAAGVAVCVSLDDVVPLLLHFDPAVRHATAVVAAHQLAGARARTIRRWAPLCWQLADQSVDGRAIRRALASRAVCATLPTLRRALQHAARCDLGLAERVLVASVDWPSAQVALCLAWTGTPAEARVALLRAWPATGPVPGADRLRRAWTDIAMTSAVRDALARRLDGPWLGP